MRTLALVIGLVCLTGAPRAEEMSPTDRQRLVAHLEMTGSWFLDEVSTLSRAQLAFRPAPGSWTIHEVIDHLVVVGGIYWEDLQKALKTPPAGSLTANRDADVLWYGIDRTDREKAIAGEDPRRQPPDLEAALDAYRAHHARLLRYAKMTKDDLRSHFVARQRSDAYQWALLISTHEQRHILQIREIKAHPTYPRR